MRSEGSSLCRNCYDTGPRGFDLISSDHIVYSPLTTSRVNRGPILTSLIRECLPAFGNKSLWLWQQTLIPTFSFQLILNIKWSFQAKGYSRVKEKAYPSVRGHWALPSIGAYYTYYMIQNFQTILLLMEDETVHSYKEELVAHINSISSWVSSMQE